MRWTHLSPHVERTFFVRVSSPEACPPWRRKGVDDLHIRSSASTPRMAEASKRFLYWTLCILDVHAERYGGVVTISRLSAATCPFGSRAATVGRRIVVPFAASSFCDEPLEASAALGAADATTLFFQRFRSVPQSKKGNHSSSSSRHLRRHNPRRKACAHRRFKLGPPLRRFHQKKMCYLC